MKAGGTGAFLISWEQTEINGVDAPLMEHLVVGASWAWRGICVPIPDKACELVEALYGDTVETPPGKANTAHDLVHMAFSDQRGCAGGKTGVPKSKTGFVLTDGAQRYAATVIETAPGLFPVLLFDGRLPPRDSELLVVENRIIEPELTRPVLEQGGVICFTPGTLLTTATGQSRVQDLRVGDLVQTKDNGLQPIQWIGSRRLTGARMFAMPELCPVRVSGGAFGISRPDQPLLVSPHHRVLVSGATARELFGASEMLVAARDLVSRPQIAEVIRPYEVTYVHILLPDHSILWANGVQTESFHPANAALSALEEADWKGLLDVLPFLKEERSLYGEYARPQLTADEARRLIQAA